MPKPGEVKQAYGCSLNNCVLKRFAIIGYGCEHAVNSASIIVFTLWRLLNPYVGLDRLADGHYVLGATVPVALSNFYAWSL